MAKNQIKIEVVVDDKGNLKSVGQKAQKASKNLDSTARSAQNADRALKGTAQASSNSTKNFAKMSQGISGGLVPAYATLAANIFAVSAAFNFLKDAGNLVALQRGQEAYAASTGIALRSLTRDLIDVTKGQIGFQEASQAAAIGTAAGLSGDQLKGLAEGAKNASIILGRDLTDSFNRLIRGVTKAEPELLDELGIILRLERATANYSQTINKNVKDFSEFERSQAVAVEVLTQLEDKYNRIAAATSLQVNEFNQLGKAFESITNRIKEFSVTALGPLAKAITESPTLGIALMGLFAKGVITAALPAIGDFAFASTEAFERAREKAETASQAVKELGSTTDRTAGKLAAAARAQQAAAAAPFKGPAFTALAEGRGGELSSRQISGMLQQVRRNEKIKGAEFKKTRQVLERELQIMLDATRTTNVDMTKSYQVAATGIKARFAQIKAAGLSAFAAITRAANLTSIAISRIFAFAGYVGFAVSLFEIARGFITSRKEAEKLTDEVALQEAKIVLATDKVASLNEEFKDFVIVQKILTENGAGAVQYFTALGNQISSLSSAFFDLNVQLSKEVFTAPLTEAMEAMESDDWVTVLARRLGFNAAAAVEKAREEINNFEGSYLEFLKTSEDARLNEFGERLQTLIDSASILKDQFDGQGPIIFRELLRLLNALQEQGPFEAEATLTRISEILPKVNRDTQQLNSLSAIRQENERQVLQLLQERGKETQEVRLLRSINNELKLTLSNELGIRDLRTERIQQLNQERVLLEEIIQIQRDRKVSENAFALARETGLRNLTSLQKEFMEDSIKIAELASEINFVERERDNLLKARALDTASFGDDQEFLLQQYERQLVLLKAQKDTILQSRDAMQQYANAVNQAYETGLQTQLARIFKGEESSLRRAILTIGKGIIDSVAETAAENLTRTITGSMSGAQAATAIGAALVKGGEYVASAISRAFTRSAATASVFTSKPSAINTGTSLLFPRPSTEGPIYRTPVGQGYSGAQKLGSMFGLPSLTFGDIRGVSSVAKKSGFVSFLSSFIGNILPFANGGIAPGGIKTYASGGIVSNPTLGLVGEGRYNEAIVPLPDGKSIPVDIKRSTQENNIVINVSNEGAITQQGGVQQSANLGKAIAIAVQKELQNQKRPGGILSPFGAA